MRQHIALSEFSYNVINCDMLAYKKSENISAFISHILLNHYDSPEVSLLQAYFREEKKIRSCYEHFDSNYEQSLPAEYDEYYMYKLIFGYIEYRLKEERIYPNQITIKPYIKNDVSELLDEQIKEEQNMFGENSDFRILGCPSYLKSKAAYIKNILEHYARLSPYQRELVIYKNLYKTVTKIEHIYGNAKDLKSIRLNLFNIELKSGEKALFKPYRITKEHETQWPCLIGFVTKSDGSSRNYYPEYIPLSDIDNIKECAPYLGSGKLTAEQMALLDKQTAEYGLICIQPDLVSILFNDTGLQSYLNAPSPKPYTDPTHMIKCSNGRTLLHFKGNANIISRYFASYGDYALILSPKEANDDMLELFSESAASYEEYKPKDKDPEFDAAANKEISLKISKMKENPKLWYKYIEEYKTKNIKPEKRGIYALFLKLASEGGFEKAYGEYADLLFEGYLAKKDYDLAGEYYSKCQNLSLDRKYKMASIFINGLCKSHSKQEGSDILTCRNLTEEKIFEYQSPEGYTFYAPLVRYQDIYKCMD